MLVPLLTGVTLANTGSDVYALPAELTVLTDGVTVVSTFTASTCQEPLRLEVDEGPQEVRVTTLVEVEDRFGQGCDGAALQGRLTTTLQTPLGDRRLVAVPGR